jgi:hypothetical protein
MRGWDSFIEYSIDSGYAQRTMKRRKRHWLLWGLVVVVLIFAAWFGFRPNRASNAADSTLGPIGGPSIAQDVNTLVGQKAQSFSLPDASGAVRHIIPGQGRTVLLVFHMGRY